MDLTPYLGPMQAGQAYRFMLERDVHAPGSVDRVLWDRMVRLCDATADHLYSSYTPTEVRYQRGTRLELERYVQQATARSGDVEDQIAEISRLCAGIAAEVPEDEQDDVFGGTEEAILHRKTDWCVDLARAACALYQVANLPARLVILADTSRAYSGHQIVEVHRSARWGAVDPATDVVYRRPDGSPASTRDLMVDQELVRAHNRGHVTPYTYPDQFRFAAIVNYFVWEADRYDYAVSGVNDYYASILAMARKGWPGGLRWLHGEDDLPSNATV